MKGFIELTSRFYDSQNNKYIISDRVLFNVNHIFIVGDKFIKTIEDVQSAPTLVVETYDEIKRLISEAL